MLIKRSEQRRKINLILCKFFKVEVPWKNNLAEEGVTTA